MARSIKRRDAGVCSSGEICEELGNIVAHCVMCEPSCAVSCLLCRINLNILDLAHEVFSVHNEVLLLRSIDLHAILPYGNSDRALSGT